MRIFFYFMAFLMMMFGISFAMLNPEKVLFQYYIGSQEVSLSILLALALGVGICIGILLMAWSWVKLKKNNLLLKRRLKTSNE